MSSKIIVLAVLAMLAAAVVQVDATPSQNKIGLTSPTSFRVKMTAQAILPAAATITVQGATGVTGMSNCRTYNGNTPTFVTTAGAFGGTREVVLTVGAVASVASDVIIIDCDFAGTPTDNAWTAKNSVDDTGGYPTGSNMVVTVLAVYARKTDSLKYTIEFMATTAIPSGGLIALGTPATVAASTCVIKVGATEVMASGAGSFSASVATYTTTAAVAVASKVTMECTLTGVPSNIAWTVKTTTSVPGDIDAVSDALALNMFNTFGVVVSSRTTSSSKALTFTLAGPKLSAGEFIMINMPTGYALGSANTCKASFFDATNLTEDKVTASAVSSTTGIKLTMAATNENQTVYVTCTGMTIPASPVSTLTSWSASIFTAGAGNGEHPRFYATSYSTAPGMTAKLNYVGVNAKAMGNAVATNTGVFTLTLPSAVADAASSKYNNLVLFASDTTNAFFTAGVAAAGSKCTVTGASYTQSTDNAGDTTTGKVILRSAAAGGAITANTKLTFTCTNMTFTTSAATSDLFGLAVETNSANTNGAQGTPVWYDETTSNASATQQVGTTASSLKVLTKATSSAAASTATEGTIGAAPAGYWVNESADQVIELSFTGLTNAITAGTNKVITVTVPWGVDTTATGTKADSTISVGGTDKTSTYTITSTATTVVFTPSADANGAIGASDAVVIRLGKIKRTGAPSSSQETFTVASAGDVNTGDFYLPWTNGAGFGGSTMKAHLSSKKLSGSVTGFVTALDKGASNTSTITPDTTYTFVTTANGCTGSLPAGKAVTSAQTATVATLTLSSTAAYDTTVSKTSVLAFSCTLATVPSSFASGKTVKVTRGTNEDSTFALSQDTGSSAATASSTVGVVLGAVFGVVGLAQLTL